jgi:hypothetical protein
MVKCGYFRVRKGAVTVSCLKKLDAVSTLDGDSTGLDSVGSNEVKFHPVAKAAPANTTPVKTFPHILNNRQIYLTALKTVPSMDSLPLTADAAGVRIATGGARDEVEVESLNVVLDGLEVADAVHLLPDRVAVDLFALRQLRHRLVLVGDRLRQVLFGVRTRLEGLLASALGEQVPPGLLAGFGRGLLEQGGFSKPSKFLILSSAQLLPRIYNSLLLLLLL